jgi:hypothetical protein
MKRYTLLRITAIVLEVIGYLVLFGGLLLGVMIFAFSYNVLPTQLRLLPSALLGTVGFVIWIFTFGHFLVIAHVIQVCLRSHDNTEQILDYLKIEKVVANSSVIKEETPLSKWLKENPDKGVNDYYANL